ncbi:MAG: hypothetical protein ACLRPE_12455 [Blautia producta]
MRIKTLLFQMISTILIVICMVSTFLYFVVKKKKISKTLNDKEDFFLKIGIGIILLIVLFKMFIPTILDIPHYLKNDFNVVSGYARDNANGKGNIRHVTIINQKDKQEIYVEFSYSYEINKGDYLKVKYLPYTKYGILLEKKSID